jgi:hypothetical protein
MNAMSKRGDGRISADAAYLLARVDEPQEREALAKDVVSGRLTRDALSRKLRRVQKAEEARVAGPARITAILGEGRAITIAGKALTLDAVIEWVEQLLTRAKKSRSQGLTLETFVRTLKDQARA